MNSLSIERITQIRELFGLTKTQLAEHLSVSVAAVTQWENGSKSPTAENLESVCQVLGTSMSLLLIPIPGELTKRGPLTFRATATAKTSIRRRQAHRLSEMAAEVYF